MLYFDIRPCLNRLTDEEAGELFKAILDYGENGVVPEFDGSIGVAWDFIQPRIDNDARRYEEVAQKRKEAAQSRWSKEDNQNANDASASLSMQMMPTTTPSPSTTTTSPTTRNIQQDSISVFSEKIREILNQNCIDKSSKGRVKRADTFTITELMEAGATQEDIAQIAKSAKPLNWFELDEAVRAAKGLRKKQAKVKW